MNNSTHPRSSVRPVNRGVSRPGATMHYRGVMDASLNEPVLLRREIGEVLRAVRQHQGRTLREVSAEARVSLGYLSEVERGQKEASSELLGSIYVKCLTVSLVQSAPWFPTLCPMNWCAASRH